MKISKQPIIICWLVMLWAMPASGISGNVYPFEGLDTLGNRLQKVYSPGVRASWLGESSYFWYENRERKGTAFYLVDAASGKKRQADTREGLAAYLEDRPELAALLKGQAPQARQQGAPAEEGVSPDGKWKAFIRNSNVYLASLTDKDAAPVILSNDGAPGFAYGQLRWSPDSKKLAAMKVREVKERQIPLLESAPESQLQPKLRWINRLKSMLT